MSETAEISKLNAAVSSLQQDMAKVGSLVDRLDVTIEKLTEVSTTVSQLLAVQGNRLEFQERIQDKIQDMIEKRKTEFDTTINSVYKQIGKVETDLQNDIEEQEEKIINKIQSLQDMSTKQHEVLNDRISRLEKWMWAILGGSIVLAFLVDKIDLSAIF